MHLFGKLQGSCSLLGAECCTHCRAVWLSGDAPEGSTAGVSYGCTLPARSPVPLCCPAPQRLLAQLLAAMCSHAETAAGRAACVVQPLSPGRRRLPALQTAPPLQHKDRFSAGDQLQERLPRGRRRTRAGTCTERPPSMADGLTEMAVQDSTHSNTLAVPGVFAWSCSYKVCEAHTDAQVGRTPQSACAHRALGVGCTSSPHMHAVE